MVNLPRLLTFVLLLALSIVPITGRADNLCSNTSSTATSGSLFDSGGSGGDYQDNESCSFLIQPTGGGTITLSFSSFNYESGFDEISVYDGTSSSGTLLGTFTGSSTPSDLVATSGTMEIVHSTDSSVTQSGLNASWTTGGGGGSCPAKNVADNFNSVAYNLNNGTQNWATDWLEVGESDGVSAGIARVRNDNCSSGNCLRLGVPSGNPAQTYSNIGVQREVNLSDATSATLTFNYRTGYSSGTPLIRLWASNDGGASWILLQDYSFSSSSFSDTAQSFDLTPYISSNTRIRFLADGSSAVSGFYVDNIDISYDVPCTPVAEAEWRFEESSWNGSANEVIDSSGNNHHGSAQNGANTQGTAPALTGDPGTCRYGEFDSTNQQYIEAPLSSSLNPDGDFSVSLWARIDSGGGIQSPITSRWRKSDGTARRGYNIYANGSNWQFWTGTGTVWDTLTGPAVSVGLWTHIVITFSSSSNTGSAHTGTKTLYINGVPTTGTSRGYYPNDMAALLIGAGQSGSGHANNYFINGAVDEVKIFNRSLTSSEVSTLMAERHACAEPTLRGEWQFEELAWNGSANEVQDSSGNNNHGTAFNNANTLNTSPALVGDPGSCRYAEFDGSNDYVSLGNPAGLNFSGEITLMSWIRPDNSSGHMNILAHGHRRSPDQEVIFRITNGSYQGGSWNGSDHFTSASIPAGDIGTGTWVHLASVYDGTTWRLFRNGVQIASNTDPVGAITVDENWAIGARGTGTERFFDGGIDEVRIYNTALSATDIQSAMAERHACPAATVDHLSISHSGSAITCAAETITLSAHQSDHSIDTSYTQTVNLTTSTGRGDWSLISGSGTLNNGTANDGAATYNFVAGDNGSVQLGLSNTTVEVLNINASDGSISEASGTEDQDLSFKTTGLRFLADSTASAIGTQISGKDSDDAPGAQTLELQAIRTDSSGTCEAALSNSHSIDLAYECLNPGTCSSSSLRAAINGTNIEKNNSGTINNYQSVTLDFGDASDSTAAFTLNYPDAGQIRLHASYNISGIGLITGSSNNFVVKPAGLCVEATDAGSACSAGDATCSAFKKAGEAFNLEIKGVGWQNANEANTDFCSGNSVTPNFELSNIALTANLIAPLPGTNVTSSPINFNISTSNNTANQIISEVGVFTLTATPPNYLGETIAASSSANIGRFYPDHFNITPGSITEACVSGGFTYLGQDFVNGYTLTAKNTADATTLNYKGNFARLSNTLGTFTFAGIDNSISGSPIPLSSRLSNSTNSVSWLNGVGSASSTLNLSRLGTSALTTADGPFALSIGILVSDADGATILTSAFNLDTDSNSSNDHIQTNSTSGVQRYGRLVIDNAFGPEVLDLAMPVRSEYWTGSAFTTNTNDLCSVNTFTANNFMISDPDTSDSLTAGLTSITYPLTGSYTRDVILSAPNKAGPLDVSLDVPDWLEFNFNGGLSDDDPSGRALFGQYRGNDRIIYWRE